MAFASVETSCERVAMFPNRLPQHFLSYHIGCGNN
jgi:hypothetical protein